MKKRLFAFVLVLCVAATLLPVSVMADGSTDDSLNGGDGGTTVTVECADSPTEKHDWSNGNGECKYCGSKCTHDWDNVVCKICSMICPHAETLDDCSCAVCGVYLHDWNTDGVCNNCGAPCDHAAGWSGGCCNTCGKVCTHEEASDDGGMVSAWDNGICGVCGKVCTHETLSDDGASVSAWENGVCGVCGMTQPEPEPTPAPTPAPTPVPHSHYYTSRVTTAAGCVTPGVRTYFCSCGASYTESIPATGHDWKAHYSIMSGDNRATYTCSVCGESEKMDLVSPNSGVAGLINDEQQTAEITVESVDGEAVKENIEVVGALLPNGGTAYVISEKVAADSEAAQSISIKSENEDIRYVGYRRTDEKGVATEILELNAAQGLASVDILRGELENGTPTVTVKENGRLVDLTNVSASLDDEQLSYSITTESGSEWSYSTGSTVKDLEAAQEFFDELQNKRDNGGLWVDPVVITTEEPQGHFMLAGCIRSDAQSNHEEESDREALQSATEAMLDELNSVRDGGFTYLETSDGGVLVPSAPQTGEGNNEDTLLESNATPEPSATPTPTPAPESAEDVWVTVSFETKTLYEDEPTIATVEDDSPTIVRFVDTTPTPAPIQEYVTPTPSPTPVPTPTPIPTYDVDMSKFLFTEGQKRCDSCGEWYYPSQGHSCKKCVPTGTLITLADGTKKAVEDITAEDICLVFDHESGSFTTAEILFLENDGVREYTIVNLEFSDGSVTRLIDEHGYFDLDEMGYVYIHADNCFDYIGHRFYKAEIVDGEYVPTEATLVDAYVTEETTGCYSFPTVYYLNFFADGFLSMPGGIAGMFNFFDYDDDLAYNAESMAEDIATYGVFEYENLADILTREEFAQYPAQYLNVALGKGLFTQDDLEQMIARYVIDKR